MLVADAEAANRAPSEEVGGVRPALLGEESVDESVLDDIERVLPAQSSSGL